MFKSSFMRIMLFLLLTVLCVSCSSYVGLSEIKSGLNNLIGTNYSTNVRLKLKNWSTIKDTETHFELEQTMQTGCSYAILVNKQTDIIESWRITSAIELCEQAIYVPSV
ncbi:MAG: hypothetical protein HOP25_07475 [Methylotenera sp.]|nr:hypothetical protein [Methylotenera sp.]